MILAPVRTYDSTKVDSADYAMSELEIQFVLVSAKVNIYKTLEHFYDLV